MLRLRRLKVHSFRTVKSGTEIRFHDRYNVLLGRNGTGKTLLLELVSMCLRFNFREIQGEDFDVEFDMEEIRGDIRCFVSMRVGTRLAESVLPKMPGGNDAWIPWEKVVMRRGTDMFVYEQDGSNAKVSVNARTLEVQGAIMPFGQAFVFLGCLVIGQVLGIDKLEAPILASVLESSSRAFRFDESLGMFERLMNKVHIVAALPKASQASESAPSYELSVIDAAVSFAPPSLRQQVRTRVAQDPESPVWVFKHDELPFLQKVTWLMGFESSTLEVSLKSSQTDKDGNKMNFFSDLKFLFTRKGGLTTIPHDALSYGQKRLLTLYYYLEANPFLLIADDLAGGLHHEWVKVVMGELGGRQMFFASQNSLVLDHLSFGSADDVRYAFVLSSLDDNEQMSWRNMSEGEAGEVFSAWADGQGTLGQMLRDKGLW